MAQRFKHAAPRERHFLREWRKHSGLSQERMGEALGRLGVKAVSKASISRIEWGKQPYTQDVLEAWGQVVGRSTAELLARPPSDPEEIWALWDRVRVEDRKRAAAMLRAFLDKE